MFATSRDTVPPVPSVPLGSGPGEPPLRQSGSGPQAGPGPNLKRILGAVATLQKELSFDPEVLAPDLAVRLVSLFGKGERLCAAGKALAAGRVSSTGAWRKTGERSPAHWMARETGTSVGQATNVLETAGLLAELPGTRKALCSGQLSEAQAVQIASAASKSPGSEKELLEAAKAEGLGELKQRCEKVKAAAVPDELSHHEAIHRKRYLRHWREADGAFRLDARLTPETGAVVLAAVEPVRQRLLEDAQKQGRREPYEALGADALVEIAEHSRRCSDDPSRTSPAAMVHVRVDHGALVRGTLAEGEVCEVPGVGPISVAAARSFLSDSVVSLLSTEGLDIRAVKHLGRTIPARLRTAIEDRDPKCVVPGCSERRNLEIDHLIPVAEGGPTCLDNLGRLCRRHHYLKTFKRHMLSGGPGSWVWTAPSPSPGTGSSDSELWAERSPP